MSTGVRRITAMAFVDSVPRSIAYYAHLGFTVGNTFAPPGADELAWAWLESGEASLMVSKASGPVAADQQAILFYMYVEDVPATREVCLAAGMKPGPINKPFYSPQGEFRLEDPDGYVLMISHV